MQKRKILYTQTKVLLACSLQLNDWSSHSRVKTAKFNTNKMIIIPKSPKYVPVNNSHLKVHMFTVRTAVYTHNMLMYVTHKLFIVVPAYIMHNLYALFAHTYMYDYICMFVWTTCASSTVAHFRPTCPLLLHLWHIHVHVPYLFTLREHTQQGLQYLSCVSVHWS